jgi:predicted ATPase
MASLPITTIVKMMEELPEPAQRQVVDHLREYIAELQDESEWDMLFARTQSQLAAAAQRAKKEIAKGRIEPMDDRRL